MIRQRKNQQIVARKVKCLHEAVSDLMAEIDRLADETGEFLPDTSSDLGYASGKLTEALDALEIRSCVPLG